jgi:hypothetical protein
MKVATARGFSTALASAALAHQDLAPDATARGRCATYPQAQFLKVGSAEDGVGQLV